MNWKKFLLWFFGIIIGVGAIGATVTFVLLAILEKDTALPSGNERSVVGTESEDFDKETVNAPLEEDIVLLVDGTSGHTFISNWHDFYNETLGWGKIETASYTEQKEAAETILQELEGVQVKNKDIADDFQSIKQNAQVLINEVDRNAMRNLHRYFHDLDIYFNGYNYNQTFGITEFTGG